MAKKQQNLNLEYSFFAILQDYYKNNKGRIKKTILTLLESF